MPGGRPRSNGKTGQIEVVSDAGEASPEDQAAFVIADQMQYGEDAKNPLLQKLIAARVQLQFFELTHEGKPLVVALWEDAQAKATKRRPWWTHMEFHERICQALRAADAAFFRELTRLLETRIGHAERRVELEVARAFSFLRSQGKRVPTKKEVREEALYQLAFWLVLRRRNSPDAWSDMHDITEDDVTVKPEVLKEIRKEMEQYPTQNWTRIFKRCGLEHLPNDKSGPRIDPRRKVR